MEGLEMKMEFACDDSHMKFINSSSDTEFMPLDLANWRKFDVTNDAIDAMTGSSDGCAPGHGSDVDDADSDTATNERCMNALLQLEQQSMGNYSITTPIIAQPDEMLHESHRSENDCGYSEGSLTDYNVLNAQLNFSLAPRRGAKRSSTPQTTKRQETAEQAERRRRKNRERMAAKRLESRKLAAPRERTNMSRMPPKWNIDAQEKTGGQLSMDSEQLVVSSKEKQDYICFPAEEQPCSCMVCIKIDKTATKSTVQVEYERTIKSAVLRNAPNVDHSASFIDRNCHEASAKIEVVDRNAARAVSMNSHIFGDKVGQEMPKYVERRRHTTVDSRICRRPKVISSRDALASQSLADPYGANANVDRCVDNVKSVGSARAGKLRLETPEQAERRRQRNRERMAERRRVQRELDAAAAGGSEQQRRAARPYSCAVCRRAFRTAANFTLHERTHTGDRPHVCGDCQRAFSDPSALRRHRRCVHDAALPRLYVCDACGKAYRVASSLRAHQATHTGDLPYSCGVCGKRFSSRGTVASHVRSVHGDPAFACGDCGRAFGTRSALTVHRRVHSRERPFACDACGRRFASSSNLRSHRAVHAGDRRFVCDACGASFARVWSLTVHRRRHTGQRPHRCRVCARSFSQSGVLRKHMRTHRAANL